MSDPTRRFSNRVEDYVRYRPDYPPEVVTYIEDRAALQRSAVIADIGSGTGKSCLPFLERGYSVIGVEPNAEMRAAGDVVLASHSRFRSVDGRAEATGLDAGSVDLILVGQAFHWFDPPAARKEFSRVLRSPGWVALVWNDRSNKASAFLAEYEEMLLRNCPEYQAVAASHADEKVISAFFAPAKYEVGKFSYRQIFDLDGLRGRTLSGSYVPKSGPAHDAVMRDVEALFTRHARDGRVLFDYETRAFVGKLL